MKDKKEKITYIDDGSTICDMSSLNRGAAKLSKSGTSSGFKDIWRTYWTATKMMIIPTLMAAGLIAVAFGIIFLLFKLM